MIHAEATWDSSSMRRQEMCQRSNYCQTRCVFLETLSWYSHLFIPSNHQLSLSLCFCSSWFWKRASFSCKSTVICVWNWKTSTLKGIWGCSIHHQIKTRESIFFSYTRVYLINMSGCLSGICLILKGEAKTTQLSGMHISTDTYPLLNFLLLAKQLKLTIRIVCSKHFSGSDGGMLLLWRRDATII